MPVASKKDGSVILFDLATPPSAKQALVKICTTSYYTAPKDLTKLILFNSNVTKNYLNARHGGYENIYEVSEEVTLYHPKVIHELITQNNTVGEANWLEGLLVALKSLEDTYELIGGIVTLQLLFITDLKTPLGAYDHSLIDKVVSGLKQLDAYLYVVGPDVEPPFTIKSTKDVKKWMQNLDVASNENLMVMKKIIQQHENTVVCSYKLGVHLFNSMRNWGGTQPWQVPLSVGSKIEVPAQTMKVLDTDTSCKLSKPSTGEPVWIHAEDESIEVDKYNVIFGIMRHEKFVQMPETKMFQIQNPRGFNILCFTDSVNVPEYLMRSEGCYRVFANGTPTTSEPFNILVDCLAKQNKYAIARRIYNNNFNPKISVLVPQPEHNPKCFLMTYLPFSDSVRVGYKEKQLGAAPKVETCEEVYSFLDSINIEDEKSTKRPPLGINMMLNYNIQRIINKIADKIFGQSMELEELDLNLMEQPTSGSIDALKILWTERNPKEGAEKAKGEEDSDEEYDW